MSQFKSGFFDAVKNTVTGKYDREYGSQDFMELFALFFTNGIFADYGTEFATTANGTMELTVGQGFAFIDGAYLKNPKDYVIQIENNSGSVTRNDGIFLTKDILGRECYVDYRPGSITPQNDDNKVDLLIYKVSVSSNASSITQAKLTDMRATSSCGFVGGAVQQMSVSGLYAQFTEQFQEWFEGLQKEWQDEVDARDAEWLYWFNNVKGVLSEDAAGNLMLQIEAMEGKIESIVKDLDISDQVYKTLANKVFTYDSSTSTLKITIPT